MKTRVIAAILASAAMATSALADDDIAKYQDEARNAAKELMMQMRGEMMKEMQANGPVSAIKICQNTAPAIASEMSRKHGWHIGRVSQKTRNPFLGMPDAWEQKVLAAFDQRLEKENPVNMEFAEIVTEPQGKFFRYMKAVPVQDTCLQCHGTPDTVSQAVKDKLASDYPHDKATGYTLGQIRGGITVKRPLF